jgi:hypothetical protein
MCKKVIEESSRCTIPAYNTFTAKCEKGLKTVDIRFLSKTGETNGHQKRGNAGNS